MKTIKVILVTLFVGLQLFQLAGDNSYNCHNYAWETERRWLEDPTPYINAATECPDWEATRIVYYDGETPIHSGKYLGNGWVESKWGSNPVIVHPVNYSTYGTNVKFFK